MLAARATIVSDRGFRQRWLAFIVLLCLAGAAQIAEAERRYEDGPLVPKDFQGRRPAGQRFEAETKTRLGYTYNYRTFIRPGRTTARLSRISLSVVLEADRSWNLKPDDNKLLAHEQGHFDITQVIRLRAEHYWRAKLSDVQTVGETESKAVANLDKLVKREMEPFFLRIELLQKAYDKATRHGQDAAAQQQWRKALDACLKDAQAPLPPIAPEPLRP